LAPSRIRELLDSVPLTAHQAHEAGFLDGVCYEDEVAAHLGAPQAPVPTLTWDQARGRVLRPRRWRSRQAIAVIGLEGMIVLGDSRRSPVPVPLPFASQQAGSSTLVQQIRAAAQDKHIAAVILHVDSPGGSALASDLIWRELEILKQKKPLVIYMSNQAASGGYYVSAPAQTIYAQPTTLTGSIGIWGGKIVTRGLFDKVRAQREAVSRGAAAGLYTDMAPFSEEQRAKVRAEIGAGYARFKTRVAEGRGLSLEEVESVARGRVWTGEQALAEGLVDELGNLQAAAERARELAGISPRRYAPLVSVSTPKRQILAQPSVEAGQWLAAWSALLREGVYALAPWTIRIHS
jgi:protease-4